MVLREALMLVGVGVVAGIPLAFVAGRAIAALLFGVAPADPLAFSAGALMLLIVSLMAAYLPAYRASRIEPMTALSR
jgi:ABC-type antimicrobial peptide transport system permease subunit